MCEWVLDHKIIKFWSVFADGVIFSLFDYGVALMKLA